MTLDRWLVHRSGWLTFPSVMSNFAGAAVGAVYASFALTLSPALRSAFFLHVVVCALVFVALAEAVARRGLSTLAAMGSGQRGIDKGNLLLALREVQRLPGRVARLNLLAWGVAVLSLSASLRLIEGMEWEEIGRLLRIGALVAPLTVALGSLLVSARAQVVMERLTEGVSVEEAYAALEAPKGRLRWWIIIFTAVMAAVPALMLMDLGHALVRRAVEVVAAAEPGQRDAAVAAQVFGLVWRLGLLFACVLTAALVAAWNGATLIIAPLHRVAEQAARLGKGELDRPHLIAAEVEVFHLVSTFARMKERLYALVRQLQGAGGQTLSAAKTLQDTAKRYEAGATEQAAALNETSATTEELAESARQISANAASVLEISQRTLEAAESGQSTAEAFQASVERMKQDNQSIATAVVRLQQRVQQIGRIVEFINTVADRSDLLALSAELEGTRAGDVGRGFALVSTEMRRLAENVLESTAEVEELIGEIRTATDVTARATDRGSALTEGSTALALEVTHALATVAELARQTANSVRTISLATQQQQSGTDQLAEAMADILGVTQEGLSTTRQLTQANARLQALSSTLGSIVDRFRIVA